MRGERRWFDALGTAMAAFGWSGLCVLFPFVSFLFFSPPARLSSFLSFFGSISGGRLHVGVRRKAMTLSEKASAMLSVEDVSLLFQSGSASPQDDIDKLQATASLLDAQIKSLVLDNRELLLEETARVRGAGKDFQKLLLAVRSLQSVASRVKAEVAEPQAQLASKIRELSNMYSTVAILRQATHQIKLVQRIKAAYDGGDSGDGGAGNGGAGAAGAIRRGAEVDLPKLARLLTDAEQAWEEADLAGIRVCEENQAFVKACKGEVLGRAMALLERGVESRAQADVGGALLALHGLGELGPCLDELLQEMVQRVKKRFMRSLDAKRAAGTAAGGIGGIGGIGGAGQSHRNESQVWEELEKSMEELRESALCAWHLEKVFRKKQDLSGSKLVDLVDEKVRRPFETFWTMSLERMKDCFEAAMVARNRVVRDQLVGQYQRLAGLLDATLSSIVRETMDGRSRAVTDEQAQQYYAAVAGVESVYLNQIQARFESVALTAFPGGSRPLPSQVDLQALNARFFEEMKRAQSGGERIVALTAATLGAVLLTVATQARDMGEVLDIETIAAQERNLALARSVEDLAKNVNLVCSKLLAGSGARTSSFKSATTLSSPATASVKAALALEGPADVLRQTSRELLEPIFRSKTDELRHVIEKMHSMNFAAAQGAESEVAMPSSYVQELNRALEEFGRGVLRVSGASPSGDVHKSVALALLREMCDALIRCWIHHASFVRPLTPPGKLQLAKDAIELEAGLRQLVSRINTTQLQEFKKLLFTETDDMSDVKVTVATLGKTVTLNHLFSRLPEGILSPHRRSRLSQAQYFVWIEDHSDEEALKQIELALVTATDDPVVRLMKCVLQC